MGEAFDYGFGQERDERRVSQQRAEAKAFVKGGIVFAIIFALKVCEGILRSSTRKLIGDYVCGYFGAFEGEQNAAAGEWINEGGGVADRQ